MTLRGAVGGAAAVAVLFSLKAGERAKDSPAPGNPVEGPGLGALRPEPLASGRSSALEAGVPPPAASFFDPPPRLRAGGPQLCLGGCGGNRQVGWTGPSP